METFQIGVINLVWFVVLCATFCGVAIYARDIFRKNQFKKIKNLVDECVFSGSSEDAVVEIFDAIVVIHRLLPEDFDEAINYLIESGQWECMDIAATFFGRDYTKKCIEEIGSDRPCVNIFLNSDTCQSKKDFIDKWRRWAGMAPLEAESEPE